MPPPEPGPTAQPTAQPESPETIGSPGSDETQDLSPSSGCSSPFSFLLPADYEEPSPMSATSPTGHGWWNPGDFTGDMATAAAIDFDFLSHPTPQPSPASGAALPVRPHPDRHVQHQQRLPGPASATASSSPASSATAAPGAKRCHSSTESDDSDAQGSAGTGIPPSGRRLKKLKIFNEAYKRDKRFVDLVTSTAVPSVGSQCLFQTPAEC